MTYDLIIVGTGCVGLATALAVAKQTELNIALIDAVAMQSTWSQKSYDARVYAITPGSQQFLTQLEVWQNFQRISPYLDMEVWDGSPGGLIEFKAKESGTAALGHIVEENLLREALMAKVKESSQVTLIAPLQLTQLKVTEDGVEVYAEDQSFKAQLIIGADGAESWVRKAVGINSSLLDYRHQALIAQVKMELPHAQTARQLFMPQGPLAFLPLQDPQTCSIVWSQPEATIQRLLSLSEAEFKTELSVAFEHKLGEVLELGPRYTFPLYERHAETYLQSRVVLVGDAAHTLHPLAGMGMNLGLDDAKLLAATLAQACQKAQPFWTHANLRRYERARKAANFKMLQTVKLLKTLFTHDNAGIQQLRSQGLKWLNHLGPLKRLIATFAMGRS